MCEFRERQAFVNWRCRLFLFGERSCGAAGSVVKFSGGAVIRKPGGVVSSLLTPTADLFTVRWGANM